MGRFTVFDRAGPQDLSLLLCLSEQAQDTHSNSRHGNKYPAEEGRLSLPCLTPWGSPMTSPIISLARIVSQAHSQTDHWGGEKYFCHGLKPTTICFWS